LIFDISVFRIIVVIVAILGCIGLLRLVHKQRLAGYEFLIWSGLLVGILILGIYPELIIYLSKYISLSSSNRYDRLIQLSFTFSFVVLALVFFYRSKLDKFKHLFIRSIQEPLVKKFIEDNANISGQIKLLILIPAYNEEGNLGEIISRVPKNICGIEPHILVISDGSTDLTAKEALDKKVMLVEHPTNFGQCMAYRTGYQIAIGLKVDNIVHLDADGQYQPEELEILLRPIIDNKADLVSGSRLLGKYEQQHTKGHFIRSLGVRFFNIVLTVLTGKRITDSASGFRAMRVSFLPLLTLKQDQFHSSELLIESLKNGAIFKEVPVSFLKRISGDSKKPNSFKYGLGFINAILSTWTRK
jgi:hypothetical protein